MKHFNIVKYSVNIFMIVRNEKFYFAEYINNFTHPIKKECLEIVIRNVQKMSRSLENCNIPDAKIL
ncbi:hypothetical protein GLOIN_2v396640 [Rhizophagus irregularis DAOM 181602=DAOM 197198]|uniref:Uncharacterized protein n=1 Tax=Rhizophagus irregularis (strain DAOM 181602 / DAOM 197198 / MUCL 43194) TaxID=747089 RepID=A0A2P4PKT7_RHIID|nr:hypothetical protein GLOIN_2v396640 [Rhizophagus irregularis DAOM 181602=DAOM 197198]POG66012.1 hypothetical protein GLOIN_2v396640 [Rhizophagus irregularis DAOM 181602=DAOM 197198]|eukprot:XP_025172878.1 hypothetical protein GLOIN_2v396640 [Rhizophagus irregularis DAOM 181602=DAOM 197198]